MRCCYERGGTGNIVSATLSEFRFVTTPPLATLVNCSKAKEDESRWYKKSDVYTSPIGEITNQPSCIQPSTFNIYGRPKLIEFVKRKSPLWTNLDFFIPSGRLFSFTESIYFPSLVVSPILIQLIPFLSSVR